MDTIALISIPLSIALGFGLLGLAAAVWGVDSRPSIGDDHAR